jgi:hypothetical protein
MASIEVRKARSVFDCVASLATILNRPPSRACICGYTVRLAGVLSLLAFGLPLAGSAAPRQKLSGHHVPAAVARLAPTGSLPGSQRLSLAIGLPLRNEQELDALLQQLYDPASPNYHRYLTPAEFTARFGPAENDYQALVDFAKSNGLSVTLTHPNRVVLDVEGAVADIQKAFHLTLRTYRHPREAREFYAPDAEPSVDFAVRILQISGLDNYWLPRPNLKLGPTSPAANATPNIGTGLGGSYLGNDFRTAYVPETTLTGTGQSVGLLEFDGFYPSDITSYESQAGYTNVPLTVVPVNGGVGTPGTNSAEVSLDIEMTISMAPGLDRVYVYEAPRNPANFDGLLNRMANDNVAKQLSSSWTLTGGSPNATGEQIFKQMGAQGQSFFNASGDYDAYNDGIPFPSDSPNITVVGGTVLKMNGTGASYASETVWNDRTVNPNGGNEGSSGGISANYAIPLYQQETSMVANQGSTTKRNVPDVALTAENVYVLYGNGKTNIVGGTSAAAPLWAGFTALVNQQAAAVGLDPVGFLNPALYGIGNSANYAAAFHDTTTGDNTWPGSPSLFHAVPGYDLCSGWGTPNGPALINILTQRAPWIISQPQSQTINAGASATFSVMAKGKAPLNYQWFFEGQPISTATSNSFSIARVQSSQVGAYTVVVSNFYGSVESAPATLTTVVGSGAFGIVGSPFVYLITADNNPTGFSASGLPPGLRCDNSGIISGTPTEAGTFQVHVVARSIFSSVSANIIFSIKDGAITSGSSAFGVVGAPFAYLIAADNNPIGFSASALPPGLRVGITGIISGTPTEAGTFPVHVEARNIFGSASATIVITIDNGSITSATTADGIIGVTFFYLITANNNPSGFSASGLPPGLRVGITGIISGTPTETGTFQAHVEAKNIFESASATVVFTIRNGSIGGGTVAQPALAISQTGGNVLLAWPVTPDGVVLEETQVEQNTWTNSSANVVVQGNKNVASIPIQSTAKFYRLRKLNSRNGN